jgi:hypothetical protein
MSIALISFLLYLRPLRSRSWLLILKFKASGIRIRAQLTNFNDSLLAVKVTYFQQGVTLFVTSDNFYRSFVIFKKIKII